MYLPLLCLAKNHANKPVRAFPTCNKPVGLGANRTLVILNMVAADCADYAGLLFKKNQCHGFGGDGLFSADHAKTFHRFGFDMDGIGGNAENLSNS